MKQMKGGSFNASSKVRDGSADSGQSSSPDTNSSSSASIADSLEDNQAQPEQKHANKLNEDDVLTIKNYQDAGVFSKTAHNNNNDIVKTTTPTTREEASKEIQAELAGKENSLHSTTNAVLSNNNNNNNDIKDSSQLDVQEPLKQTKQQVINSTTTNNNYSGLNLNMTASEMREIIARRKKFDPKKAQMNIRQKYEIIQQM